MFPVVQGWLQVLSVCTYELRQYEKAYFMFRKLHSRKNIDDETREDCIRYMKDAYTAAPNAINDAIQKNVNQLELEIKIDEPSSSLTSNVELHMVVDELYSEIPQKFEEKTKSSVEQQQDVMNATVQKNVDQCEQEIKIDESSSSSTSNIDPHMVVDEPCSEIPQKSGEEIKSSFEQQQTNELEQKTEADEPSSSSTKCHNS